MDGADKREDGEASGSAALASPLDSLLGYRLRRASMTMMGDLADSIRPLGLSVGEASVLLVVGANPDCRQSDVGRTLEIKRANLTPLMSRMKGRGLISDARIDGRSLSVRLTAQGETMQQQLLAAITRSHRRFRARLAIDEATLIAALEALAR